MKTIEEINEIAPYHPLEWQQGYGIWQDGFMEGQKSGAEEQKAIDIARVKDAFNKTCGWLAVYPWYNGVFEEFVKILEE